MRSQITTYFNIVVLATCFSVLIAKVSAIYCVQCSSSVDPFCHLGRMHDASLCPPSQDLCVTTVVVPKFGRGGTVTRGCTSSEASGCRMKDGAYICKLPCHRSACNTFNFLNSGLQQARPYGSNL